MKPLGQPVSEKKNFGVCLLCSYVQTCDPRGGVNSDTRGKYQSTTPVSEKNFEDGLLCFYVPTCDTPAGAASFDPRFII